MFGGGICGEDRQGGSGNDTFEHNVFSSLSDVIVLFAMSEEGFRGCAEALSLTNYPGLATAHLPFCVRPP